MTHVVSIMEQKHVGINITRNKGIMNTLCGFEVEGTGCSGGKNNYVCNEFKRREMRNLLVDGQHWLIIHVACMVLSIHRAGPDWFKLIER